MTAWNAESLKKSHATQRKQHGEGYAEEMKRRQALRKTHGTGGFRYLKEHDPERFKRIIAEREAKRKDAKKERE